MVERKFPLSKPREEYVHTSAVRALALWGYYHSHSLGVVEDWEADAVLDENREILHFHHWRPGKELKEESGEKGL